MRVFLILLLGLLLNACNQKQLPPNILLIVVDDLGYSDLHCYGNELQQKLERWRIAKGANMPAPNPQYKPDTK